MLRNCLCFYEGLLSAVAVVMAINGGSIVAQPVPTGACCEISLGCLDGIENDDCFGSYLGDGTTCSSPDNQTCPIGACCNEGICEDFDGTAHHTQTSCEGEGGTFLGDGTTCATANTTCLGACCLVSFGCGDSFSKELCDIGPGTYLGNDTTCASQGNTTCPIGACCNEGICKDFDGTFHHTQTYCEGEGGTFLGEGTTCATANTTCRGACCLASLGCGDSLSKEQCDIGPGTYLGNDTTCASEENTTCPIGACCMQGVCEDDGLSGIHLTQSSCEAAGGVYVGDGTTCATNNRSCRGACCWSVGCTDDVDENTCVDLFPGTYLGDGSTCTTQLAACPTGACCLEDACIDFASEDYHVGKSFCEDSRGSYLGDGSDCATANTSCMGACCWAIGCTDAVTEDTCVRLFPGTYLGHDTTCETQLDACPTGACCLEGSCIDFESEQYHVGEARCEDDGGLFLGSGSDCATTNTSCRGACCWEVGCSHNVSEEECLSDLNGTYLGNDSTCQSEITACPTGACCWEGDCLGFETLGYGYSQVFCDSIGGIYLADGASCAGADCTIGACTTCCECSHLNEADCAAIGREFHGMGMPCGSIDFVPDTTAPQISCPDPISLKRGDNLCTSAVQDWLGSVSASDDCSQAAVSTDAPDCGFPFGTTTVTFTAEDECENTASCTAEITVGPAPRVDISKKGSLLFFSKVDLRWNAAGELIQDTFLSLLNDFPGDVNVQMYFVNGDAALDPLFSNTQPPVLLAEGEPGWNWVDCQLLLTPDQPIYWSAFTGSPAGCQPFTILDPDLGSGPGRPVPGTSDGSRMLRGFVIAFAVNETGAEIAWDHLSGKATIVNYADASAWEYAPFAFQTPCGEQGEQLLDCAKFDEQGVCCTAEIIPSSLGMDGVQYDYAFDALLLDFFAVGSPALSGGGVPTTVDTDLTLHILSADLRQETEGPVTTKAHFDIWNSNERKLSNTRRCLTCWDQTMLSQYGAPNSFLLANLQSDKGKARIDGKQADECEKNCLRNGHGEPLDIEDLIELLGDLFDPTDHVCSQDAALLGLVAKHLTFSGPAGQREVAGSELVGMGLERALIQYDIVSPPGTLREAAYQGIRRVPSKPVTIESRERASRSPE